MLLRLVSRQYQYRRYLAVKRCSNLLSIDSIKRLYGSSLHGSISHPSFHTYHQPLAATKDTTMSSMLIQSLIQDSGFEPGPVQEVVLSQQEQKIKDLLVKYCSFYDSQQQTRGLPKLVTRITGGWVRDKLLGRESNDLDIAVNLITGLQFAEGLNEYITAHGEELGIEPQNIHKIEKNPEKSKHLETATTRLYGLDLDFVNLRSEVYAEDSRIPEASFGTAEEDAFRRDATLNALFYNLQEEKVEDFTGKGLQDLENGILRTPLEPFDTFNEDPLRVLRLIRFASTFGFQIASECLEAMRDKRIESALMRKISRERVGIELAKALTSSRPQVCLALIETTNLYNAIFHLYEIYYTPAFHDDGFILPEQNIESSLSAVTLVFDQGPSLLTSSVTTKDAKNTLAQLHFWLAVALNPWESIMAQDEKRKPVTAVSKIIRDGVKLSTNDASTVSKLMNIHANDLSLITLDQVPSLSRRELGLLVRKCDGDWQLVLLYGLFKDIVESPLSSAEDILQKHSKLVNAIVDYKLEDAWLLKPILNGKEVSKLYGSKGGQWLAKALQHLIEYQLENPDVSREQATEFMVNEKKKFL